MTDLLFGAGLFVTVVAVVATIATLVERRVRRRPTLTEAAEALRFARLGNDREAEARAREAYHDALRREGVL